MTEGTEAPVEAVIEAVIARVKTVYRSWGRTTSVAQMRSDWDALFGFRSVKASVESGSANGVAAKWIAPCRVPRCSCPHGRISQPPVKAMKAAQRKYGPPLAKFRRQRL